jgi:surface protein
MFYDCINLQHVPLFNTSNVIDMSGMFYRCFNLESIPFFDTHNVVTMDEMFAGCRNLTTIPQLDTSNVSSVYYTFSSCNSLTSLPLLNFMNVENTNVIFGYNSNTSITDLGGFKDLGMVSDGYYGSLLGVLPNLTHESLMNVINNLYDRRSAGYMDTEVEFGETNLNKLNDNEKLLAINKGWILI